MNRLGRAAFFSAVVLSIAGCHPKQEEPPASTETPAAESGASPAVAAGAVPLSSRASPPPAVEEPTPGATAPIAFESELEFIHDTFKITVHGEGNRKLLMVQAIRDGKPVGSPAMAAVDGDVVNAYAADLDGDQNGEILVFTRGRGEGKPGAFAGFAFVGDQFTPLNLPELDAVQAAGYRGGDSFNLDRNRIVRKFPVFEGDGDQPTGKVRTITYALQAGLAFAVENTDG